MTYDAEKAWNTNAQFWDEKMGDGNLFHKELVEPSVLALLSPQPGEKILDLACGNGQFSRLLDRKGCNVTACDISENLLAIASKKTGNIRYLKMNVCDEDDWKHLESEIFDKAVSNMALMDMDPLGPFFRGCYHSLKSGGVLVVSQLHPAFNVPGVERHYRWKPILDKAVPQFSLDISAYMTVRTEWGAAMEGQPVPHPYYLRPLSVIWNEAFSAGFILDGGIEPVLKESPQKSGGLSRSLIEVYQEFPPIISLRFRKP